MRREAALRADFGGARLASMTSENVRGSMDFQKDPGRTSGSEVTRDQHQIVVVAGATRI